MEQTRRKFLKHSGAGLLTFYAAGCELELTPEDARTRGVTFGTLTESEVGLLDAFGEVLLPGSADKGLSHFIDHQLSAASEDQLLMIKYLGVPRPYASFYQGGLAALDTHAVKQTDRRFQELDAAEQADLVGQIAQTNPDDWQGPPSPLFCFVLRNDALDVVYGTKSGVESLDVPYMAHIDPPSRWGE